MKNNIALMSDWGVSDGAVGSVKGVIFGINPDANIIDMSHDVGSWDIRQSAFLLMAHYKSYPRGTIFVVVIDPGVGTKRKAILVESADYFFMGPDNGVLSWALRKEKIGIIRVVNLTNDQFFRKPVSSAFEGRDVFAPVAALLSKGFPVTEFGDEVKRQHVASFIWRADIVQLEYPLKEEKGKLIGEVLFVDKFGNLISSIERDKFSACIGNGDFQIYIGNNPVRKLSVKKLSHTYADGKKNGEVLAFFGGDFGDLLDIAVYEASAAEKLGTKVGDKVVIKLL